MPVSKPYNHIYRHGSNLVNAAFYDLYECPEIQNHISSYEILKRDLRRIFEYVEPVEANVGVFSHRLFELLVRACTDVESLCRLVFSKNGIALGRKANIIRFSDLEGPMQLSDFVVYSRVASSLPDWRPFEFFRESARKKRSPPWYQAYNAAKHNRVGAFFDASLANVLGAVGGVYVLLAAQVGPFFDTKPVPASGGVRPTRMMIVHRAIPEWSEDERYEYSWSELKAVSEPFQNHHIPERP